MLEPSWTSKEKFLKPLHWAAEAGNQDVVNVLLGAGVKTDVEDEMGMTPLHLTAHRGHEGVVVLLLSVRAKTDVRDKAGKTPLHWTVNREHLGVITLLLDAGTKTDIKDRMGQTPLQRAFTHGNDKAFETLFRTPPMNGSIEISEDTGILTKDQIHVEQVCRDNIVAELFSKGYFKPSEGGGL